MRLNKSTARPGTADRFEQPKVLVRDTGGGLMATYDDSAYYAKDVIIIEQKEQSTIILKVLAILLNSRLLRWYYETTFPTLHVQRNELASLPIPHLDNPIEFAALADSMLSLNSQLQEKRSSFLQSLSDNFDGVKITSTLQQFDTMDFKGLMAELKKQKIRIPVKEQGEWKDYFNERVAECQELSAQIKTTDNEIDNRVFDLYGLTEEERKIVMEG